MARSVNKLKSHHFKRSGILHDTWILHPQERQENGLLVTEKVSLSALSEAVCCRVAAFVVEVILHAVFGVIVCAVTVLSVTRVSLSSEPILKPALPEVISIFCQ